MKGFLLLGCARGRPACARDVTSPESQAESSKEQAGVQQAHSHTSWGATCCPASLSRPRRQGRARRGDRVVRAVQAPPGAPRGRAPFPPFPGKGARSEAQPTSGPGGSCEGGRSRALGALNRRHSAREPYLLAGLVRPAQRRQQRCAVARAIARPPSVFGGAVGVARVGGSRAGCAEPAPLRVRAVLLCGAHPPCPAPAAKARGRARNYAPSANVPLFEGAVARQGQRGGCRPPYTSPHPHVSLHPPKMLTRPSHRTRCRPAPWRRTALPGWRSGAPSRRKRPPASARSAACSWCCAACRRARCLPHWRSRSAPRGRGASARRSSWTARWGEANKHAATPANKHAANPRGH